MIETPRLIIRLFNESDAKYFFDLTQDPGFNSFPITKYTQKNMESAAAWIADSQSAFQKNGMGMFAVWERNTQSLIGVAGLREMGEEKRVEVTYRLKESAWGKGYATEAAKAVVDYGFEKLDLQKVSASITSDNQDSKKVAAKLGMELTGTDIIYGVKAEIFSVARGQKSSI